jgi:hypothetical protein
VVPPAGQLPGLAGLTQASVSLVARPERHLRIENTYLLDRLTDRATSASVFNNDIIRSVWTWQFNPKFSLRVIPQYNSVLANTGRTSLSTSKNFNADFLMTYLLNPFTALYIGYNQNMDNLALLPYTPYNQLLRTQGLLTDGHQFFVKFSRLFNF